MALAISTLSLAGISTAADGQRETQDEKKRDQQEKQQKSKQDQDQDRAQGKSDQDKKGQQQQQQAQKEKQEQQDIARRKSDQDEKEQRARQQQQQERIERQSELFQKQQRALQQQKQNQVQQQKQQERLSQQQQQKLISQQQQRVAGYRQYLEQQERLAKTHATLLQQQKRIEQYRFQQRYLDRVLQQRIYLRDHQFDYANDPYFYTAPIYRYTRGGNSYQTNEYGARTLQQAVNYGYEEGFSAGKADRDDRWRSDYKDSYAYRDANYGYSGYYVDRRDYNHYFREGFRRGYEDGYNTRYQYGRLEDGNPSILETILSVILNFQALS
jgi:hypothetical protein